MTTSPNDGEEFTSALKRGTDTKTAQSIAERP
jgi:hypothetical protein